MLDPRSAIGAPASPILERSSAAIAPMSPSTPASIRPSLAPWPRWSNEMAANPAASTILAKSWWLSLQDPAPWRITTPPWISPDGIHSEYASPSHVLISLASATDTERRRRTRRSWHDREPMSATVATLSHVYPLGTRVNERGRLEIGGCDTVELAREFGTPAYVVAEDDLRARARAFLQAIGSRHEDYDVLFASKAFPCSAVYRVLAAEGLACDVASGGELHLALKAGFDPARIYLHGNAKSEAELREALEAGVGHIVLDSFDELGLVERLAAEAGHGDTGPRQEALIRVTPDVTGETHHAMSSGQADSKFGFSLAAGREAVT